MASSSTLKEQYWFTEVLLDFLETNNIEYKQDVNIREWSYFRTGGTLKFLLLPNSVSKASSLVLFLKQNKISYRAIGATSNVLFTDDTDQSVFISLKRLQEFVYNEEDNILRVGSGVMIPALSRKTAKMALGGFEGIEGIPGTVGGAIFMNAEAFGCQISDYLIDVQVLDNHGNLRTYLKDELNFTFRHSTFHDGNLGVILGASFNLLKDKKEDIVSRLKTFSNERRSVLEHAVPNLGSIFATKDIYLDMARHDLWYSRLVYLVRSKFLGNRYVRKVYSLTNTPLNNNKLLNYVTCKYFGLKFKKRPYSDKTMNTFNNENQISTAEILDYVNIIRRLTHNKVKVEVEIA